MTFKLDQKYVTTRSGSRDSQSCPYRCLPNPALAGDDEDPR